MRELEASDWHEKQDVIDAASRVSAMIDKKCRERMDTLPSEGESVARERFLIKLGEAQRAKKEADIKAGLSPFMVNKRRRDRIRSAMGYANRFGGLKKEKGPEKPEKRPSEVVKKQRAKANKRAKVAAAERTRRLKILANLCAWHDPTSGAGRNPWFDDAWARYCRAMEIHRGAIPDSERLDFISEFEHAMMHSLPPVPLHPQDCCIPIKRPMAMVHGAVATRGEWLLCLRQHGHTTNCSPERSPDVAASNFGLLYRPSDVFAEARNKEHWNRRRYEEVIAAYQHKS